MRTTQQAFHPMRGHIVTGCEIACDNGDVLTIMSTMRGWELRNQQGDRVGTETNDANTIASYVDAYGYRPVSPTEAASPAASSAVPKEFNRKGSK